MRGTRTMQTSKPCRRVVQLQQHVSPITPRQTASRSIVARLRSPIEQAKVRAFRPGQKECFTTVSIQCMSTRYGRNMIAARALSATQAESQQPKVFALRSSASRNLPGTQGHTKPGILLQDTSGGLLTVLSNSSDFLPYAVVISALLAL